MGYIASNRIWVSSVPRIKPHDGFQLEPFPKCQAGNHQRLLLDQTHYNPPKCDITDITIFMIWHLPSLTITYHGYLSIYVLESAIFRPCGFSNMLYLHVETTSIASIAIACQENEVVVLRQRLTEGESRDSPIEGEAESENVDQAVPLWPPVDPRGFPQEKTCGTQPEVGIYFDLLKPF